MVDIFGCRSEPRTQIKKFGTIVSELDRLAAWLIAEGCTSVKVYLTYEGLKLDDYEVLEVLNVARRE